MNSVVALIPARGGSKGLPRKNLRSLGGKPLIAWTIEAALGSKVLQRILVSTDDPDIAAAARQFGAEVPFDRPKALAQDDTPALEVALHALAWLEEQNQLPEKLLWLQPTSPFRTDEDIRQVVRIMNESDAPAVISVVETKAHPWQVLQVDAEGILQPYLPSSLSGARRQELPKAYQLNGALYLNRTRLLREQHTFLPAGSRPYLMPPERSLDIDTAWDFFLAETLAAQQTA